MLLLVRDSESLSEMINPEHLGFNLGKSNVFYGNFSDTRMTSLVDTHGTLSTDLPCLSTKLAILVSLIDYRTVQKKPKRLSKMFDLSRSNPEHPGIIGVRLGRG